MPMPTFVIVGERRSGTTSLSYLLDTHPDVFMHEKRDLGYFIEEEARRPRNRNPDEPLVADPVQWERTHSANDYAGKFEAGTGYSAIGEKSADYLFWSPAHKRMAEYLPDTRFIITLREPVARAWSHYWNEVGKGRERLSFEDALDAEDERCRISAFAKNHLSYAHRGFYDETVSAFLSWFSSDRVLVIHLEEILGRKEETLARVFQFFGVDPARRYTEASGVRNANWTMVPKKWTENAAIRPVATAYDRTTRLAAKSITKDKFKRRRIIQRLQSVFREPVSSIEMPCELRSRLSDLYRPHNQRLQDVVGREFHEWT